MSITEEWQQRQQRLIKYKLREEQWKSARRVSYLSFIHSVLVTTSSVTTSTQLYPVNFFHHEGTHLSDWWHSFLQRALHFAHHEVLLHTFGQPHYVGEFTTATSRCPEKSVTTSIFKKFSYNKYGSQRTILFLTKRLTFLSMILLQRNLRTSSYHR